MEIEDPIGTYSITFHFVKSCGNLIEALFISSRPFGSGGNGDISLVELLGGGDGGRIVNKDDFDDDDSENGIEARTADCSNKQVSRKYFLHDGNIKSGVCTQV